MKSRKKKEATIDSPSYMQLALHTEGSESLILRVPTFWDDIKKQWIGAIQTPVTKKIISAAGNDSFDLQNNFNKVFSTYLHDPRICDEVFKMFKPLSEWK